MTAPDAIVRANLERISRLADQLQVERDRLAAERARLLGLRLAGCVVGGVLICRLDPGQLQTRADASLSVIEAVERFVADVLPTMEKRARAGDVDASQRALVAAQRILGAVVNLQPFGDLVVDADRAVKDTLRQVTNTGMGIAGVVLFGFGVYAAVQLFGGRR
jgi:hypothetical protein